MSYQFAQKFDSPIQNNIGPNFGDDLNFVTCEQYKNNDIFVLFGINLRLLLTAVFTRRTYVAYRTKRLISSKKDLVKC